MKAKKAKLTKRAVEAVKPGDRDVIVRDTEISGFCFKVTPSGRRSYFLYYRTRDGRERRPSIGVHGNITCDEARVIAKGWSGEIADGSDPSATRKEQRTAPTFATFAKTYMDHYAPGKKKPHAKKASSLATDEINLRRHILPALGRLKVAAIVQADIERLHQSMAETPGAANRTLALLSHILNFAEKKSERPLRSNPCVHIEKYPIAKRERFLTLKEIGRLGAALAEAERARTEIPAVIAAIRMLLLTGCRLSEILTLEWDFVDLEGQRLRLPDSKTGAKTVYLPAPALQVLSDIGRKESDEDGEGQERGRWVIAGRRGDSHLVNLQKPWRRLRKAAGLEDVRIHDLRHTFASTGVGADLTLPMVGKLLGHTQAATTQRYAHLADDPVKQAAEKVGAIIGAAMEGSRGAEVVDLPKRRM